MRIPLSNHSPEGTHVASGVHIKDHTTPTIFKIQVTYCVSLFDFFSFDSILFYWSTADLQCCVSFCCTAESVMHIHISTLSFPI